MPDDAIAALRGGKSRLGAHDREGKRGGADIHRPSCFVFFFFSSFSVLCARRQDDRVLALEECNIITMKIIDKVPQILLSFQTNQVSRLHSLVLGSWGKHHAGRG